MVVLIPGFLMGDPTGFRISKLTSSMVPDAHTVRSLIRLTLMAHQVTILVTVITSFDKWKTESQKMRDLLKLIQKSS